MKPMQKVKTYNRAGRSTPASSRQGEAVSRGQRIPLRRRMRETLRNRRGRTRRSFGPA